jgi:FkbM family methyltransferase
MPTLVTRYGELLVPDTTTDIIGRFLARYGEWAWLEAEFVASVLPPEARVLDVGAFIGTFGLGVATARALHSLICVEANAGVVPLLRDNLQRNAPCASGLIEAMVAGRGAATRPGRVAEGNLGGTSFVDAGSGGTPVPAPAATLTLSELRARHGPFDLVKLDVEGMEHEALMADAAALSRGETAIWAECNDEVGSLHLARLLLSWSPRIYYFAFPAFNPDNFAGDGSVIFPWAFEAGLLAFPPIPPRLSAAQEAKDCILRCIDSVEALRDAMWRTPRWGMPEWPPGASRAEIVALAGRTLRSQTYEHYLREDFPRPTGPEKNLWERLAEAEAALATARVVASAARPPNIMRRLFRRR